MPTYCKGKDGEGCGITATFGLNGKMTHCIKHKSDEMYHPHSMCIDCKKTRASFGLNGKMTHCKKHKSDEMYNIKRINAGKIENDKKGCTKCGQMKDFSEYKDAKGNDTSQCSPCRTRRRQYANNKYATDENYRIKDKLRTRVHQALGGKVKSDATMKLIGCTIEELIEWLNYNIEKDINIEYDIDHFLPCNSFDLKNEEEQRKCFHWSNLQLLPTKENLKKSDTMPTQKEIDERQKIFAEFLKQ